MPWECLICLEIVELQSSKRLLEEKSYFYRFGPNQNLFEITNPENFHDFLWSSNSGNKSIN